jgi:CRP/FNR family transcriptional regulator, cyclic AMP receptor protein
MTTTAQQAATPKSGIRNLMPGEVLFNDGDVANSLYIIQKGQVRLYKPKGKGFIEIGVLRAGEVIGEMAFFDEDGSGKKRSCAASALTHLEIIEISFVAFAKTMQSLNPWFKTIINTLATRLRKTNLRVKELEDNQASVNYGGKIQGYEFMKPLEVMRILGTLFLVFKSHGEVQGSSLLVNKKILSLYTFDMYQIMEVKLETVFNVLVELGWMEIKEDSDGVPNLLYIKDLELVRQLFIFYNTERHLPDNKKMRISDKAEQIIGKMLEMLPKNGVIDIPNLRTTEDNKPRFTKYYVLNPVLEDFKNRNITVNADHLEDGRSIGLFGELVQESGRAMIEADMGKVQKMYPVIRFMNTIRKTNEAKA